MLALFALAGALALAAAAPALRQRRRRLHSPGRARAGAGAAAPAAATPAPAAAARRGGSRTCRGDRRPRRRAADAQQGRQRVDDRRHAARDHDVDPGPRAVLRRPRPLEEHAVDPDAGVRDLLADRRAVGDLRLQHRVHRGQRLLRRARSVVPERHLHDQGRRRIVRDGGDIQQGRRDSRVPVRRVPGDVRGNHGLPHRRRVRRAREVLGGAAVRGAVVHVRLPADRAHGLVLAGPGRRSRTRRRSPPRARRAAGCGRRARSTSRAARSCTSTPASPAWWAPT